MALTNEDLTALSQMLDTKLDNKLEPINDRLTRIELKQENDIIPRLQNIESCYISTYKRYRDSVSEHKTMKSDIEMLKKIVAEHSKKLECV